MFFHTITLLDKKDQILTRLPANFRVSGNKIAGSILLLAGIIVAANVFPAIYKAITAGTFQSAIWSSGQFIYGPLAMALLLGGLDQLLIKGSVVVEKHRVLFNFRDLLGKHDRVVNLSGFVGIKKGSQLVGPPEVITAHLHFTIFLIHKDRRNNLRIYKSTIKTNRDKQAVFYTELFELLLINK